MRTHSGFEPWTMQDERLREQNTLLGCVKDLFDRKGLDFARLKFRC